MEENAGYPAASYGIPGHIWANSGTIATGDEREDGDDAESSEEFKYTPGENREVRKERSLQDVVDNDSSYKEEDFGKKTLEESEEKGPEQNKQTQEIENQSDSIQFTQKSDDQSSNSEDGNKLLFNSDSGNQPPPILMRSDHNPS